MCALRSGLWWATPSQWAASSKTPLCSETEPSWPTQMTKTLATSWYFFYVTKSKCVNDSLVDLVTLSVKDMTGSQPFSSAICIVNPIETFRQKHSV